MLPRLLRMPPCIALVFGVAALVPEKLGAQIPAGQHLFEVHCAACHGPHGEGGKGPTLAQPTLPRAPDVDALMRVIKSGLSGTEMPSFRINPEELPLLAAYVKGLGSRPAEAVAGNALHGAQLFATKGACATCHTVRGFGGAIGPDLTEIGLKRSAAYLRRALVDPAADVPQSFSAFRSDVSLPLNFLFVRLATRDGRAMAGVRVNEDTFSIQIRDLTGKLYSFERSELAELHKDWGFSPMPSYAAVFTPPELDDLVAYLASLRNTPSPAGPETTSRTNTVFH